MTAAGQRAARQPRTPAASPTQSSAPPLTWGRNRACTWCTWPCTRPSSGGTGGTWCRSRCRTRARPAATHRGRAGAGRAGARVRGVPGAAPTAGHHPPRAGDSRLSPRGAERQHPPARGCPGCCSASSSACRPRRHQQPAARRRRGPRLQAAGRAAVGAAGGSERWSRRRQTGTGIIGCRPAGPGTPRALSSAPSIAPCGSEPSSACFLAARGILLVAPLPGMRWLLRVSCAARRPAPSGVSRALAGEPFKRTGAPGGCPDPLPVGASARDCRERQGLSGSGPRPCKERARIQCQQARQGTAHMPIGALAEAVLAPSTHGLVIGAGHGPGSLSFARTRLR